MALEDFTPEPEASPAARPEEVNPLLEAEEDEDLFDFPPVVAFAEEEEGESEPPVKTPPAFLDDFDRGDTAPGEPDSPQSQETSTSAAGDAGGRKPDLASDDLALDAGLWTGVGEFDGSEDGPVEDTLRRISELESEPEPPSAPRAPAPAAAPSAARPVQIVAAPAPGDGWTRVALIAATAICLLEVGIIGVVWQTNRSFVTALLEVRAERGLTSPERIDRDPSEPQTSQVTPPIVTNSSPAEAPVQRAPAALPPEDELALSLADEEIQGGRYAAARRRLRRLLATIDRVDERRRDRVAAEAAYRIAQTYRLQAEAMEER